ncbi:MAG TPA: adenylate/guanylate cyclase domain-containing protein, partial [Nitriliruptorales bacterium]|nr:adenylate/guanylate cyclase domain-containing protein [Nitriliruptorales bacterium]
MAADDQQARASSATTTTPDLAAEIRSVPITGERKPVTALFADVVGSTALAESMDPEDWVALMNRAFEAMSASIQRYGGTITQFSGDAVVAFFGAPVAHEDDPERAVRAALDMLAAVERLGEELRDATGIELRIRVGVNTGPVVVGDIGGDVRHEYTALGDAVNVAARMQAAARPGTALITDDTYRLVAPRVEVIDRGRVAVKGKAEPVHAYEVVRLATLPGPTRGIRGLHSPMVGRDGALRQLLGLLDAVLAGRGRMAVVLGEPGIGKTRLLTELRAEATARDAAWVETRGLSYGADLPHHLVVGLVRSLVEAPPGASPDELAAALEAGCRDLLGDSWSTPYGYVAHLLALPLEAALAERLEGLDPAALQAHYQEALGALLTAAAHRRPVVLACEDVHWADPSSVDLVGSLLPLAHQAPVLLVCTARPERDVPGWQLVSDAREVFGESLRELRLEPLSPEQSRELVAHLLEIESLPEALRAILLGKTEGNPFFLEEVIRMLIERTVIVRAGTTWVADGVPRDVTIPDTVHGLLLARIDRLPDRPRTILRIASVIGREFPVPLLEEVSAPDGAPLGHLGTLEAAGLVDLAGTSPELRYSFRHALVQEAAYGSLLRRQRRDLHLRVAEALLRLQPDRRDELSALLAHHYEQAGDVARAAEHLLVAGERALRRFANREALAFFERAASHLPADNDDREALRRRVLAGLGWLQAGRTFVPGEDMLRVLDRVLPDAERLGDPELLARAHLVNADTRNLMGEWYATSAPLRASLQAARELAESLGDDPLRALPLALIGHGKLLAAEFAEAAELLEQAIPIL